MRDRFISRREALTLVLAAAGTMLRPTRASAERAPSGQPRAGGLRLVVRNARPLDAESPIEALRTPDTSNDLFFVRSHHPVPADAPNPWTLTIDGEVAHPVTLSLDDIRRMPAEQRRVTIECAGNGRGRLELPATSGVQWGFGAVSTAAWTGVPLAALLERAGGVPAWALHFWMEAADRSPAAPAPKFLRSIPRETALGEAFVAYEMNGKPLPVQHGGPLRLVVPRWYGMASTKWLTHVHARATESDNHFMARGYRYADGSPVDLMHVKSLITAPLDGERVNAGTVRVTGIAWTGTGTISQVEISSDGGRTWQQARLTGESRPGTWRLWEADAVIRSPGEQRIGARATDSGGNTQPEQAAPNPGGYGNNSIHEVRFRV
jgi:DMSO/TMAO reductase YedYZ molybdopterin-dependent catalytic subunit